MRVVLGVDVLLVVRCQYISVILWGLLGCVGPGFGAAGYDTVEMWKSASSVFLLA